MKTERLCNGLARQVYHKTHRGARSSKTAKGEGPDFTADEMQAKQCSHLKTGRKCSGPCGKRREMDSQKKVAVPVDSINRGHHRGGVSPRCPQKCPDVYIGNLRTLWTLWTGGTVFWDRAHPEMAFVYREVRNIVLGGRGPRKIGRPQRPCRPEFQKPHK